MKRRLLNFAAGLILCVSATLLCQKVDVSAIAPLSDNATMPQFLTDNQSQVAIIPEADYVLLGPSSQLETEFPQVTFAFNGSSKQDDYTITADQTWYLDIDINVPGLLYIYEYFPEGETPSGQWIAYKWELLQSGNWRLGHFSPDEKEAVGQHTYRIWFYGNDKWAHEVSEAAQNNLVFWTYIKEQPPIPLTETEAPLPFTPAEEATPAENVYEFFAKPLVLVLSTLIFILLISFFYWIYRHRKKVQSALSLEELKEPSAISTDDLDKAKIILPNGLEIKLKGKSRTVGRSDFVRTLDLDQLTLISRQHFIIKADGDHFYIEDLGSVNGTTLNGEDISKKGIFSLKDLDTIEAAGIISLKFSLLSLS